MFIQARVNNSYNFARALLMCKMHFVYNKGDLSLSLCVYCILVLKGHHVYFFQILKIFIRGGRGGGAAAILLYF